ncbi:MAG: L-histidine N(alpha)-methyltransferase, partial [Rubripirellula sp.]
MPSSDSCVAERRAEHRDQLLRDVVSGLSAPERSLPSKHFYDERGSQLFDRICELEEYYPTRTEAAIMQASGSEMADCIGSHARLVEYGSGSSLKTRILLDDLSNLADYVPVDISDEHLHQTAEKLSHDYPLLSISPVVADFTRPFQLPECDADFDRTCIYFPGSTIGNFTREHAVDLLSAMRTVAGDRGGLLIGVDLQKDREVLEAAYNDGQGVTADFNLNLLRRINRELNADFDLDQF